MIILMYDLNLVFATQRNLIYPTITDNVDKLREVKSAYLHFPLLLKKCQLNEQEILNPIYLPVFQAL